MKKCKFKIVYADPAWPEPKKSTLLGIANNHYDTMKKDDILSYDVPPLADDAALFLWTTSRHLPLALQVVSRWGFRFVNVAFTWVKTTTTGKWAFGNGVYTRANAEFCLLGIRGRMKPICHSVRSLVVAERRHHSAKPPEVRKRIVQLFGDLPRVELFARERCDGWVQHGNELGER